jgi:hypothetical protein
MHQQAIEKARGGHSSLAWGLNASADHFLTDAFSGGHIRTPREKLVGSVRGNIQSKVLHDLDNTNGVLVTNDRGDPPWLAYGDDFLTDPRNARNRELAQEAVRASKQDIDDALSKRAGYPTPTNATVFAAQRLIPRPVDPGQDRWNSVDYARTLAGVGAREGPGIAASLWTDDNQVRDWVNGKSRRALAAVTVNEKVRMIEVLIGGTLSVITDDDMEVIEKILGSVSTAQEMSELRRRLLPRALDFSSIGDRTRFRVALHRAL